MNCQEARRHWDLYFDSEGDAELHLRVNQHLQGCPQCASWFDAQSRLETRITETIAGGDAREDRPIDWQKVLESAGVAVVPSRQSWWRMNGAMFVAVASVILAIVSMSFFFNADGAPSLAALSADVHRHMATGNLRPDFESDSDLAVERYLVSRVSFPVRCPPREDSGFIVRGAGLCELASQPVAYVVGAVGEDTVSVFVLPEASLRRFPREQRRASEPMPQSDQTGDYQVIYSVIDQNLVMVVGKSPRTKLERVLNAYGTYPHAS